jgi:hypothetical protein
VLAGILERQAEELKAAYAPHASLSGERRRGRLDPHDRAALSGPYNPRLMSLITSCPACGTMFKVVPTS